MAILGQVPNRHILHRRFIRPSLSSLSQYSVPVGGSSLREYLLLTARALGARRKVQEADVLSLTLLIENSGGAARPPCAACHI